MKPANFIATLATCMIWANANAAVNQTYGPINNPFNGHDYYLLPPASWSASELQARGLGGHLVTINDIRENQWVYSTFFPMVNDSQTNSALWTGLNDSTMEGSYAWAGGGNVSFKNWAAGAPTGAAEDYVAMQLEGKWNDLAPNGGALEGNVYGVVEVAKPVQVIHGPVVSPINGHSYYILSMATWQRAESKAVQMGGHLCTIRNAQEEEWVLSTFAPFSLPRKSLLYGLNDMREEGTWEWISGETNTYRNWRDGEPLALAETEDFLNTFEHDGPTPGQWNDCNIIDEAHGIVEVVSEPTVISGPPMVNLNNGHLYYLLSYAAWPEAEAKAVAMGGHLATIRNAQEDQWVFSTFAPLSGPRFSLLYGLTDARIEGQWEWISGEPVTYSNWRAGEPLSMSEFEDYLNTFEPGGPTPGQWNDCNIIDEAHGVVEIAPVISVEAGPYINPTNGSHYYMLSESNWKDAEAMAVKMGGHLATIRDSGENAWIWNTFRPISANDAFWFGLTDRDNEGTWSWVSGETSAFRNWGASEPSSASADEDFAQFFPSGMDSSKWNSATQTNTGIGIVELIDTDKDGLIDVDETSVYHTDPTKKDTDGDGLGDKSELEVYNTNPLSGDTDSDGYSDFAEIYAGKKPNDASEFPAALLQSFTAVELEFIAKAGTTFYIQSSSNLVDWVNFDGPIVGDGNVWKKVYSARGSQKTYFRVEKAQ